MINIDKYLRFLIHWYLNSNDIIDKNQILSNYNIIFLIFRIILVIICIFIYVLAYFYNFYVKNKY